jgi:hypothetical protein
MTMTLSAEMRKAVEEAGEQPLEIVDQETHERYMLLRADVFDRMRVLVAGGSMSIKEQRSLLEHAGRRGGWDDPEMGIYDDLAPQVSRDSANL